MDSDTPLEQLYKSLKTFQDIAVDTENRDKLFRYNSAFMESLRSILDDCDISPDEKQECFSTTMEQYTTAMRELFPNLIRKEAPAEPEPEPVPEPEPEPTAKSLDDDDRFVEIEEVEKFNPYHDNRGRFSTANSHTSFTIRTKDPAKQHMADMAIAREKERSGGTAPGDKPEKQPNPLNDPETIGGAKRGDPMSREEADNSNANPNFMKAPGCTTNCQSCVVAYEARLRGYDVQAKGNHNNPSAKHLSHYTYDAWIDPATGKPPQLLRNDPSTVSTVKQTKKWLEDTIQPGERYTFQHGWKGRTRSGHIISADRDSSGALRLYDPQTGKTYNGAEVDGYLKQIKTTQTVYGMKLGRLGLTRVDNKQINPQYADGIMEARA